MRTGGRCITEGSANPDRLRWRTGAIGCLLPLLVLAIGMFGLAAFDAHYAAELAEGRRGAWIELSSAVTLAGLNVPLLLLALYLGWETLRFSWRWADEYAVVATDDYLVPHGSVFIKPIPWRDLADVRYVRLNRAPSLLITLRNGRTRAIRGVADADHAAEHFAALARSRIAQARTASAMRHDPA